MRAQLRLLAMLSLTAGGCSLYYTLDPLDGGSHDLKACTTSGCEDMHVGDGMMCTSNCGPFDGGDLAQADLTPVDLEPQCTVATVATACTAAAKPVCVSSLCAACSGAGDDTQCAAHANGLNRCDATSGQCVACRTDTQATDCATTTAPICDTASNMCRACKAHSECSSGICIEDGASTGACALPAQIALVDNRNSVVATCQTAHTTRDGNSAATAYCDVSEAVSEAAMRPFALVAGSSQPYGAITLTDRTITIVGPGKSPAPSPTAQMFTAATVSVGITINSGSHPIVIDGFDLGNGSTPPLRGLACTNNTGTVANATVTLRNSLVHNSTMEGVLTTNCNVSVDANIISSNAGAGVSCGSTTSYVITNNIIASNGTTAGNPGIIINDAGSTGTIAFDTLSKNGGLNTVEGGLVLPQRPAVRKQADPEFHRSEQQSECRHSVCGTLPA